MRLWRCCYAAGCTDRSAFPTGELRLGPEIPAECLHDSWYLAVAETTGCPFWTADAKLYNAVQERMPFVRWLGEYRSASQRASSWRGGGLCTHDMSPQSPLQQKSCAQTTRLRLIAAMSFLAGLACGKLPKQQYQERFSFGNTCVRACRPDDDG